MGGDLSVVTDHITTMNHWYETALEKNLMKFKDRVVEILLGSEVQMVILQDIGKILLHSGVPVI